MCWHTCTGHNFGGTADFDHPKGLNIIVTTASSAGGYLGTGVRFTEISTASTVGILLAIAKKERRRVSLRQVGVGLFSLSFGWWNLALKIWIIGSFAQNTPPWRRWSSTPWHERGCTCARPFFGGSSCDLLSGIRTNFLNALQHDQTKKEVTVSSYILTDWILFPHGPQTVSEFGWKLYKHPNTGEWLSCPVFFSLQPGWNSRFSLDFSMRMLKKTLVSFGFNDEL